MSVFLSASSPVFASCAVARRGGRDGDAGPRGGSRGPRRRTAARPPVRRRARGRGPRRRSGQRRGGRRVGHRGRRRRQGRRGSSSRQGGGGGGCACEGRCEGAWGGAQGGNFCSRWEFPAGGQPVEAGALLAPLTGASAAARSAAHSAATGASGRGRGGGRRRRSQRDGQRQRGPCRRQQGQGQDRGCGCCGRGRLLRRLPQGLCPLWQNHAPFLRQQTPFSIRISLLVLLSLSPPSAPVQGHLVWAFPWSWPHPAASQREPELSSPATSSDQDDAAPPPAAALLLEELVASSPLRHQGEIVEACRCVTSSVFSHRTTCVMPDMRCVMSRPVRPRRIAAAYLKAVPLLPSAALLRSCEEWEAATAPPGAETGGAPTTGGRGAPPAAGVRVRPCPAASKPAGGAAGVPRQQQQRGSTTAPPPPPGEFSELVALAPAALLHRLAWLRQKLEASAGAGQQQGGQPRKVGTAAGGGTDSAAAASSAGALALGTSRSGLALPAAGAGPAPVGGARPGGFGPGGPRSDGAGGAKKAVSSAECLAGLRQLLALAEGRRGGVAAALAAQAGEPPQWLVAGLDAARFAF